jgi:hypothetical protein
MRLLKNVNRTSRSFLKDHEFFTTETQRTQRKRRRNENYKLQITHK